MKGEISDHVLREIAEFVIMDDKFSENKRMKRTTQQKCLLVAYFVREENK